MRFLHFFRFVLYLSLEAKIKLIQNKYKILITVLNCEERTIWVALQ
jgi:hypothetical protein